MEFFVRAEGLLHVGILDCRIESIGHGKSQLHRVILTEKTLLKRTLLGNSGHPNGMISA
jgi:hypothetical protein